MRVVSVDGVAPLAGTPDGADVRETLGGEQAVRLRQAVVRLAPDCALRRETGACEELLFVLGGAGTLTLGAGEHALEPETGAYLAAHESYALASAGGSELAVVSVTIPEPELPAADPAAHERRVTIKLGDQDVQGATSGREFRLIFDPSGGCHSATQFIGYIPPGRTPDHMHHYDEVIYVLEGEGAMHGEGRSDPLGPGSCIDLPARTVHCLERTSAAPMSVLGVFRPAGSPAAAYYPDGTPAPLPDADAG